MHELNGVVILLILVGAPAILATGYFLGRLHGASKGISLEEHHRALESLERQQSNNAALIQQTYAEARNIFGEAAQSSIQAAQAGFAQIANSFVEQKTQELEHKNRQGISALMQPYKEQLQHFNEGLDKLRVTNENLRGELTGLKQSTGQIGNCAQQLANVLGSGQKSLGLFGEKQLEELLAASGLTRNSEYILQYNLKTQDGKTLIPDAVVTLPSSHAMVIIDSKASFAAYCKAVNAPTQVERVALMREHVKAIQDKIKDLASKDYADELRQSQGSPVVDAVLMFIPADSALEAALEVRPELWNEALAKNILLVSPTTLLLGLKLADMAWRRCEITQNTTEILAKAGDILTAIQRFLEDFDKADYALHNAANALEKARKSLLPTRRGTGKSIADSAAQLQKLGAHLPSSKSIPQAYQPQEASSLAEAPPESR